MPDTSNYGLNESASVRPDDVQILISELLRRSSAVFLIRPKDFFPFFHGRFTQSTSLI